MHGLAMARLSSIGRAMAVQLEAWQRQSLALTCLATAKHSENSMGTFGAVYSKGNGYEVNCCAVARQRRVLLGKAKELQRKALM